MKVMEVNSKNDVAHAQVSNEVAQVTQGVSMVSTTDAPDSLPLQLPAVQDIKVEPPSGEPPPPPAPPSEKEKPAPHPMHAMTSVLKNTAKGMESNITLWQFLLELLISKQHDNIISWTSNEGEFKLLNAEEVAKLWGMRKNKHNMNYDKLSRALRYYYDKNIIKKVMGQKFVYKFVSFPEVVKTENKIPFKEKMQSLAQHYSVNSTVAPPSSDYMFHTFDVKPIIAKSSPKMSDVTMTSSATSTAAARATPSTTTTQSAAKQEHAALIAQQQAAALIAQQQAAITAQLQQLQQQQQQQQPWLIAQSPPQMVASPPQQQQQQQQPAATLANLAAATATTSSSIGRTSPRPIAPRIPSPAPNSSNSNSNLLQAGGVIQQQPVIVSNAAATLLLPQQQIQVNAPAAATALFPVPQIIPKLETVAGLVPPFAVSSLAVAAAANTQHRHSFALASVPTLAPTSAASLLGRNSISPAPGQVAVNPEVQAAAQPLRPNSAPVPGHLMENPPEYVPFSTNKDVPSFLVSVTPAGQTSEITHTGTGSATDKNQNSVDVSAMQSEKGVVPLPQGQENDDDTGSEERTSESPTPQLPTFTHTNVQSFSPSRQHAFEPKQKYSPSQAQRSSHSPYHNPRTMSPRGVSPLVRSSGSRGPSPSAVPRAAAETQPRSRDSSPAHISPVPTLVVPDVIGSEEGPQTTQQSTNATSTINRPKPGPLELPTSLSVPLPSPLFAGLKSGGLATPCLPDMTPNTITGFANWPTPMMLTSPVHFGGAQRTPVMPLTFWSSLPVLSPRVGSGATPGGAGAHAAPPTFQFPSHLNGGHMPFSPVVTFPAFSSVYETGGLHTPSATSGEGGDTVAAPSS